MQNVVGNCARNAECCGQLCQECRMLWAIVPGMQQAASKCDRNPMAVSNCDRNSNDVDDCDRNQRLWAIVTGTQRLLAIVTRTKG